MKKKKLSSTELALRKKMQEMADNKQSKPSKKVWDDINRIMKDKE